MPDNSTIRAATFGEKYPWIPAGIRSALNIAGGATGGLVGGPMGAVGGSTAADQYYKFLQYRRPDIWGQPPASPEEYAVESVMDLGLNAVGEGTVNPLSNIKTLRNSIVRKFFGEPVASQRNAVDIIGNSISMAEGVTGARPFVELTPAQATGNPRLLELLNENRQAGEILAKQRQGSVDMLRNTLLGPLQNAELTPRLLRSPTGSITAPEAAETLQDVATARARTAGSRMRQQKEGIFTAAENAIIPAEHLKNPSVPGYFPVKLNKTKPFATNTLNQINEVVGALNPQSPVTARLAGLGKKLEGFANTNFVGLRQLDEIRSELGTLIRSGQNSMGPGVSNNLKKLYGTIIEDIGDAFAATKNPKLKEQYAAYRAEANQVLKSQESKVGKALIEKSFGPEVSAASQIQGTFSDPKQFRSLVNTVGKENAQAAFLNNLIEEGWDSSTGQFVGDKMLKTAQDNRGVLSQFFDSSQRAALNRFIYTQKVINRAGKNAGLGVSNSGLHSMTEAGVGIAGQSPTVAARGWAGTLGFWLDKAVVGKLATDTQAVEYLSRLSKLNPASPSYDITVKNLVKRAIAKGVPVFAKGLGEQYKLDEKGNLTTDPTSINPEAREEGMDYLEMADPDNPDPNARID